MKTTEEFAWMAESASLLSLERAALAHVAQWAQDDPDSPEFLQAIAVWTQASLDHGLAWVIHHAEEFGGETDAVTDAVERGAIQALRSYGFALTPSGSED